MDTLNTTKRENSSTNYLCFVTMKYSTLVSLLLYFKKKNKQHVLDAKKFCNQHFHQIGGWIRSELADAFRETNIMLEEIRLTTGGW